MLRGICEKERYCYDFAQDFVIHVQIIDHCIEEDANEKTRYGIRDGTFDLRDVEKEGKGT